MATITDSIGRVLAGRYRIESALGSGASAHVFAAWDVDLRRRVAIKVLHPALAGDSAFLRRFRAEAQAAASLAHPHVLTVYDWGQEEREPFLVLELCAGGSLRDLLDEGGRLTVAQALAVGKEAAEGLAYAHGRGFVHRDVKPANLLFGEDGRLRVADFGLARALAEAAWTEPVGATLGTARYAAPEQALGQQVDGRADVYSLALVLYEAVTGVVPFTADTTLSTLMARVGARLPGHDALGPLAPVLDAATATEPEQRLDASSLAARLRVLAAELPTASPLPLAGPGGRPLPPSSGTAEADMPSAGEAERRSATDTRDTRAFAAAPLVDPTELGPAADPLTAAVPGTGGATGEPAETAGRKHRRRFPLMAAVVLLAVLLAAGGAAYAIRSAKLLVPSHRLPALVGQTEQSAVATLRRDHLTLRVSGSRTSVTLPAGRILREIPAAGTLLKEGSKVSVVLSSGPPPVPVPSLSSVTGDCTQATAVLARVGLHAACTHQNSTSVASGSVISWSPQASIPLGSTVSVVISSGPPIETIPSLTGSTCQGATTTLQVVGLVAQCTQVYSTTVPTGEVVAWSPQGHAPEGATVAVHVSEGPPPVVVPPIYGKSVAQAIQMLQSAGLVPGSDLGPLGGDVLDSTPPQGATVPEGSSVTIYSQ